MRTSNPSLSDRIFVNAIRAGSFDETMTIEGTVNRTGILAAIAFVTASIAWNQVIDGSPYVGAMAIGGALVGFVFAIITCFKPSWAAVTGPLYAASEGFFLGAVSSLVEMRFAGIVIQAVLLTFGTLFALLMAYRSGIIKATENFKLGVFAATGGIAFIYLTTFILSFFGIGVPYIHGNGPVGIAFSLGVVIVAALNLVLDFDFIEGGAERGAPKYMEWFGAFALMVTLVWLYLEILRLLMKLNSRR